MLGILKETFSKYSKDKVPVLAGSLAYYTVFSLAPILIIVISLLVFFGQGGAQQTILDQVRSVLGDSGAQLVRTMIESRSATGGNWIATLVGVALLLFGATGVFMQLQTALNLIWSVEPDPESGIRHMLVNRLVALGMVLLLGLLMFAALILTTLVQRLASTAGGVLPGSAVLWTLAEVAVSIAVIGALFALVFRVLPDAHTPWGPALVGGFVTGALFTLGKWAVGLYLSKAAVASSYGAAGSLVVLLLFVYYASQILLIGGEFTETYARHRGHAIVPDENAVRRRSWS